MNTKIISALTLIISSWVLISPLAYSDEGGVSFWLPGQFGSMAAVPGDPGWSIPLIYYHSSVGIEGSEETPTAGRITLGLEEDITLVARRSNLCFY